MILNLSSCFSLIFHVHLLHLLIAAILILLTILLIAVHYSFSYSASFLLIFLLHTLLHLILFFQLLLILILIFLLFLTPAFSCSTGFRCLTVMILRERNNNFWIITLVILDLKGVDTAKTKDLSVCPLAHTPLSTQLYQLFFLSEVLSSLKQTIELVPT